MAGRAARAGQARLLDSAAWAVALVCVLILAVSLPGLELDPGARSPTASSPAEVSPSVVSGVGVEPPRPVAAAPLLVGLALALLAIVIIAHLVTRAGRRRLVIDIVAFGVLLLLLLVVTGTPPPRPALPPLSEGTLHPPEVVTPAPFTPRALEDDVPGWVTTVVVTTLSLAAAAGTVILLHRRRRLGQGPSLEGIAVVAERALDRMALGDELGDIVIQCYAAMGRVLAEERGIRRAGDVTAQEFCSALETAGAPREAVRTLTTLFEEARYGGAPPDPDRGVRARDALTRIAAFARITS